VSDVASNDLEDIASHARSVRIAVVGGGMAGLVAAWECAKVGTSVTIFEADDRFGGVVRSAVVDGIAVDAGAESYATRGGHVRGLVDELGLADAVVTPAAGRAWVAGLPGGAAAPLPGGGLLGIPSNPWAPDVVAVIGRRGAWRAYSDRLRPPLTIGHERSLGRLVRSRMGDAVLDRLVAPVTTGVYSARPDDIDVDLAAPGLSAALTRAGSLSGAVAALLAGRTAAPGAAVEGIDGGMSRLVDSLVDRLVALGVELAPSTPVDSIDPADGRWIVRSGRDDASDLDPENDPEPFDAVIVATTEPAARHLLAPVAPGLEAETGPAPVVEVVTLVLDAPALDTQPRGTGVLTVPGSHRAKALTHSTAKWEWVARAADGRHVVRVSFGAQGEPPATEGLDDADAAALALAEASALLGVPLAPGTLRGAHRERYVQSQPGTALGRTEAVAAARSAVSAVPGLGAVGAWLSGTGLAQVVPDARAEADRVRHAALWGAGDDLG
jgi:protoporphyrinogen/coproporphyrinogen III oxidase